MMCGNGGVGCGVGSGNSGGGSGGVDETVVKGPEVVLKQYFPLARRNYPQYGHCDGAGGGGGGGDGVNVRFMLGDWRWSRFSVV